MDKLKEIDAKLENPEKNIDKNPIKPKS